MSFLEITMFFFIYAVAGYGIETIHEVVVKKKITNRGFLFGPMIPIYGFGAIIGILFDQQFHISESTSISYIVVTSLGFAFVVSVFEYITGYTLEKSFHRTWWDYSNAPLNIHGRVSVVYSLGWAILGYVFMAVIHPIFVDLLANVSTYDKENFVAIFTIYLVLDILYSVQKYVTIITKEEVKEKAMHGARRVREYIDELL